MTKYTAAYWIDHFGMQRHPEGGWWAPHYEATDQVQMPRLAGERPAGTAIYFLLEQNDFSAVHRLAADEVWHWYAGSPLVLSWVNTIGLRVEHRMGPNPDALEAYQVAVPHHSWMAAYSLGDYTLFGCSMSPGFDSRDFLLGNRQVLMDRYPQHADWVLRFTR